MMTWGYLLKAPGRPPLKSQVAYMKKAGLDVSEIGQLWIDEFVEGSTKSKKSLIERRYLINGTMAGDVAMVYEPFCLGIGPADAKWFANELFSRGVKLVVGSEEISADNLEAVLDAFARKANIQHVKDSRSGKARKRVLAAKRRAAKLGKPPKPIKLPGPKEPCVYRHFDKHDTLLYIGACSNYVLRNQQHKNTSKWFPKSARFTIELYPTIAEAREAELNAIWIERPVYNKRRMMPAAGILLDEAAKLIGDPEVAQRILSLKTP